MQSASNFAPLLLLKCTDNNSAMNMHSLLPAVSHTDSLRSQAPFLSHGPSCTSSQAWSQARCSTTSWSCTPSTTAQSSPAEHIQGHVCLHPPPDTPTCNGEVWSPQANQCPCLLARLHATPLHSPGHRHQRLLSPVSLHLLFQTPRHPYGLLVSSECSAPFSTHCC